MHALNTAKPVVISLIRSELFKHYHNLSSNTKSYWLLANKTSIPRGIYIRSPPEANEQTIAESSGVHFSYVVSSGDSQINLTKEALGWLKE